MKEKFISSSLAFITKYQECNDLKIKRLKYGLEGIYNLIVKLIAVLIIACLTKTIKETCLIILFYAGIRTFSFGWHAKNSLGCWITTLFIYNILPILIANINLPNYIGYTVLGISFIFMFLWAPADTPKRPLIRKNNRIKCKMLSLLIIIIYSLIYTFNNIPIINYAIIYALLIQILFINPLTYKLTNTRFNNYKYYKKD